MLTWNVGGSRPPPDLEHALGLCDLPAPNMYGIGLQEMNSGSSESKEWVDTLTCLLADYEYVRIKYRQQIGVLTLVFVRRSLLPYCTSFESEATKTGMGGWWGNKGGVSVRMDVCGMNLIIVNCHLAAHQDNVRERIVDFDSILDDQKFKDPDVENILDHDYVFWMGDLNFRLDDVTKQEAIQAIGDKNYSKLLANDQLNMCREEKLIFEDFEEGEVTFPPTYKFDVGTDTYDTSSKSRIPAWCDRILWHTYNASYDTCHLRVTQLEYKSHPRYRVSDHKPVTSTFLFTVFPKPPLNPVQFEPISTWISGQSQSVRYGVSPHAKASSTDWIGLYLANFSTFEKYHTYTSGVEGAEKNRQGVVVTFSGKSLSVRPGTYCLCYMTAKYSLMGISNIFQIL